MEPQERIRRHKLLTAEVRAKIPGLHATEFHALRECDGHAKTESLAKLEELAHEQRQIQHTIDCARQICEDTDTQSSERFDEAADIAAQIDEALKRRKEELLAR